MDIYKKDGMLLCIPTKCSETSSFLPLIFTYLQRTGNMPGEGGMAMKRITAFAAAALLLTSCSSGSTSGSAAVRPDGRNEHEKTDSIGSSGASAYCLFNG